MARHTMPSIGSTGVTPVRQLPQVSTCIPTRSAASWFDRSSRSCQANQIGLTEGALRLGQQGEVQAVDCQILVPAPFDGGGVSQHGGGEQGRSAQTVEIGVPCFQPAGQINAIRPPVFPCQEQNGIGGGFGCGEARNRPGTLRQNGQDHGISFQIAAKRNLTPSPSPASRHSPWRARPRMGGHSRSGWGGIRCGRTG